jgi:hypothetical protein
MSARITPYDEDLVAKARVFLDAADKHPDSTALLDRYGFSAEERARGRELVVNAEASFAWERAGKAWNFLSPTPERRTREARDWYVDGVRRYVQSCLREAEAAAGWTGAGPAASWSALRKLTLGTLRALPDVLRAASPEAHLRLRDELRTNLEAAKGARPEGAPPPKDTTLVELRGWYERWHLLAHRVLRGRADLLAPFGLTSGKAPPRLRGKAAQSKYGEGAALRGTNGTTNGAHPVPEEEDDLVAQGLAEAPAERPARDASERPARERPAKVLPIVR